MSASTWRDVFYVAVRSEMGGDWNQWPFHAVDVRDEETALCGLKPAEGWGVKLTRSPGSMSICGKCSVLERPRPVAETLAPSAGEGRRGMSEHSVTVVTIDLPNGTILSFRGGCSCGWEGELMYMAVDAAVDAKGHAAAARGEPSMADHHGLIEEAKEKDLERRFSSWQDLDINADGTEADPIENIVTDAFALIARLADALEQQEADGIATLLDMKDQRDIVVLDLATAERRAAEWKNLYEHGQVERRKLEDGVASAQRQAAYEAANADKFEQRLSAINHGAPNNIHCRCSVMWGMEQERSATLARDRAAARRERDALRVVAQDLVAAWDFGFGLDLLDKAKAALAAPPQEAPGHASAGVQAAQRPEDGDSGVSTKQLHQGMHTGRSPRRTGG